MATDVKGFCSADRDLAFDRDAGGLQFHASVAAALHLSHRYIMVGIWRNRRRSNPDHIAYDKLSEYQSGCGQPGEEPSLRVAL